LASNAAAIRPPIASDELVINLATAKAIGLTIPEAFDLSAFVEGIAQV